MSTPTNKTTPIPVRLGLTEEEGVTTLAAKTGISKAEIIRRCLRFALPEFIEGGADLLNYGRPVADMESETSSPSAA